MSNIELERKVTYQEDFKLPNSEMAITTTEGATDIRLVMPVKKPQTHLSLILAGLFHRLILDESFSDEMLHYAAGHAEQLNDLFGMEIDEDLLRKELQTH